MKHKEWLGDKNLIMKLLEKANLNGEENGGERGFGESWEKE